MKHSKSYFIFLIYFFLIPCLFFFCKDRSTTQTTSKGQEYRLFKLHYENSSGEKGVTTFDSDKDGNLTVAVWELLDGSRSSINFYTYDKNGNLEKKYREFSDSLFSTQLYEYDSKGNLIYQSYERSDGRKGSTRYEYDKQGKQICADCQGLNGWLFGLITYTYDENGLKVKGEIKKENKTTGTINYSYDENNNLIKEYWDFSGTWNQTFRYEYVIRETNNIEPYTSGNVFITNPEYRVTAEKYDYSNITGGPSEYEYDDEGKLRKKIFRRSDGLSTETHYLYDHKNRLIKSYRQYSSGLSAICDYDYFENRKLKQKILKRSDGALSRETYQYDERGLLISANYDNMDFWLTGEIHFVYDKNDLLQNGYYKGKNSKKAVITFSNDINKNVIRIHWDFSDSKTQTYIFDYEKIR